MTEEARLAWRPMRTADVVAKELEGEKVLLNLSTEEYYSLNEVGTRVWDLADGECTVAALVDTILAEYEAEREEVTEDVLALLDEMIDEGLLSWRDD